MISRISAQYYNEEGKAEEGHELSRDQFVDSVDQILPSMYDEFDEQVQQVNKPIELPTHSNY